MPRARAGGPTPGEQRVAELAASGLSNKQVAEQLSLSVYTVQAHLSRAYAKLGGRHLLNGMPFRSRASGSSSLSMRCEPVGDVAGARPGGPQRAEQDDFSPRDLERRCREGERLNPLALFG